MALAQEDQVRFFPDSASASPPLRASSRPDSSTRRAVRRGAAAALFVLAVGAVPSARATTSAEQAVHVLVNESRAASDVRLLRLSERLSRIAHRHSKEMATRRSLFHTCLPCEIGTVGRLGENVGFGADYPSVQAELMASSPHRANILNPRFRRVGVGVVRRGGLVWVTQIFYG
jgi:uncharacterized protein YkwD